MFLNPCLPQIAGVGIGVPHKAYTQKEILDIFKIKNRQIESLFLNSSIERRYLTLPPIDTHGLPRMETQGELIRKHKEVGLKMGQEAITRCLKAADATFSDVQYLCCVSSTGFLTPGFSALLIKELGLRQDCARLDVVGMGCNAGLNALSAVASWASSHPSKLALLVCIEACSAAYVFDGTLRTSVVNSLFGDGAAAIAVNAAAKEMSGQNLTLPSILHFASYMIPDEIDAMRYDWDDIQGKFSFFLDPFVPYVVGAYAELALNQLLRNTGILQSDIKHWIIHSGGKKVIDSVRVNLGLTRYDLRHTIEILREYGNVSSGSFLFSYERLLREGAVTVGDYGVMMTMGPGSTIEMALLQWK